LDRPPLIDDPWGDRLVLNAEREAIGQAVDLRAHPTYATVILRTRYTEDALETAVGGGVRQYVVVGAGMDSFALRRPAFAQGLEIFEVDLPATQEFKRHRLEEIGVPPPDGLHLVAADLGEEGLVAALARSPFRPELPTFFSWLGVSSYLTREANLATLGAIASCGAEGSELVFTYIDQRELGDDPAHGELAAVRRTLTAAGEPWVSGFHPGELAAALSGVGLGLVEDLGGDELRERYRADQLHPTAAIHIAHARA
jgi:methyltransferase (TIGR00027 family)